MKTIGRIISLPLLSEIAFISYGREIQKMTDMKSPGVKKDKSQITTEWDKIFPESDRGDHCAACLNSMNTRELKEAVDSKVSQ